MAASKFTELLDTASHARSFSIHNVSLEDILAETERRRRSSSSLSSTPSPGLGPSPTGFGTMAPRQSSEHATTTTAPKSKDPERSLSWKKSSSNLKRWSWFTGSKAK